MEASSPSVIQSAPSLWSPLTHLQLSPAGAGSCQNFQRLSGWRLDPSLPPTVPAWTSYLRFPLYIFLSFNSMPLIRLLLPEMPSALLWASKPVLGSTQLKPVSHWQRILKTGRSLGLAGYGPWGHKSWTRLSDYTTTTIPSFPVPCCSLWASCVSDAGAHSRWVPAAAWGCGHPGWSLVRRCFSNLWGVSAMRPVLRRKLREETDKRTDSCPAFI